VGAMPSSRPRNNFVTSFFETAQCTVKIRIYHYVSDKRCADFNLKMHQKRLAAGLCPDPLGSLQRSPDLLARFKIGGKDKGRRKRKKTRRDRQPREGSEEGEKGWAAGRGEGTEESGRRVEAKRHSLRRKMRHINPRRWGQILKLVS